jgi:protein-S-isoprenylcysteine O-methyltransferase Ste14
MASPLLSPQAAAVLTLIAIAAYGGLHSLTASLWAKARARRALGPTGWRLYRLAYNLVGGITFLPILAIPAIQPGPRLYLVAAPWSWLMLALRAAGVAIVALGLLQTDVWHFLGLRQLVQAEGDRPARMVTTGLYRHVRHPLYTGGLLFLWATPLMTTTLLALIVGASAYLVVGSYFEERRLLTEYGQAYADYQRRVPRLLPRLIRRAGAPAR